MTNLGMTFTQNPDGSCFAERITNEVKIVAGYKNKKLAISAEGDSCHHLLEDSILLIKFLALKLGCSV
jgi:hypothetical protein